MNWLSGIRMDVKTDDEQIARGTGDVCAGYVQYDDELERWTRKLYYDEVEVPRRGGLICYSANPAVNRDDPIENG